MSRSGSLQSAGSSAAVLGPPAPWKHATSGRDRAPGNLASALPITATANGSSGGVTIANIPTAEATTQADLTLRIEVTLTSTGAGSGSGPKLYAIPATNIAGSQLAGTTAPIIWWSGLSKVSAGSGYDVTNWVYVFEYRVPAKATWVQIRINWVAGDVNGSSLTVNALKVLRVAGDPRGLINLGYQGSGGRGLDTNSGFIYLDTPILVPASSPLANPTYNGAAHPLMRYRQQFSTEVQLAWQPSLAYLYNDDYGSNGYTIINGLTTQTVAGSIQKDNSLCNPWSVDLAAGGSQEVRGEAHGGELGRHEFILNGAIATTPAAGTSETWTVFNSTQVVQGDTYALDNERVQVTAIPDSTHITVTRAYGSDSGVPATHVDKSIGFNYSRDHLIEFDTGDGTWRTFNDYNYIRTAARVRQTKHTKLVNSDALGSPFANQDTTYTFFRDGMLRADRALTFLTAKQVNRWWAWMVTMQPGVAFKGAVGYGSQVIGFTDQTQLTAPTLTPPTLNSNLATGGNLPASTQFEYAMTAITAAPGPGPLSIAGNIGSLETLPTASFSVTTGAGATNSIKVNFTVPTGGVGGIRIYRRQGGVGNWTQVVQFTGLAPGATTWTDTAATPNSSNVVPTVSTYIGNDDEFQVEKANWMAMRDASTGLVTAMIVDGDQILAQTGVSSFRAQCIRNLTQNSINKMYFHADFDAPAPTTQNEPNYSMPVGASFTTTAWRYVYMPADANRWWVEAAQMAAQVKQLPTLYPAT